MTLNLGILSSQPYQLEQKHETLKWNKISLCERLQEKYKDDTHVDSSHKEKIKSGSEWRRHRHPEAELKT